MSWPDPQGPDPQGPDPEGPDRPDPVTLCDTVRRRGHVAGAPSGLTDQVRQVLAVIGDGEVTGYGEVARALGIPRGARAVARVLASGGFGWDLAAPVVPVGRVRRGCFVVPEIGHGQLSGGLSGELSRSAALARREVPFTVEGSGVDTVLLVPTDRCLDAADLVERLTRRGSAPG
ncbi:MGMT family protein [Corynebacterium provencense]|uniref:MGMT family protein n=1 Tax=Corynebacterium provencense TaxID=1737425 RepID=UPI000D7CF4ED|nr:MGMT family protein [Corynebacterium provencense]